MARRLSKVNTKWNNNFAYAIGVIATDGNLSSDMRHINITSKDLEMLLNCKKCLGINNKIGRKSRAKNKEKKYYSLQFGDVNFFDFLVGIGISTKKSKTLSNIKIPKKYFPHFLRGCIDGDGTIVRSVHPESKLFQNRTSLYSASKKFLEWIFDECKYQFNIKGGTISKRDNSSIYSLRFGKADSRTILSGIYKKDVICLSRKKKIVDKILGEWRNW